MHEKSRRDLCAAFGGSKWIVLLPYKLLRLVSIIPLIFRLFRLFWVRFGAGAFGRMQSEDCRETFALKGFGPILKGAPGRDRTCDRRIRNPLLYPLSYERIA
jgi:hypothetical protein